MLWCLDRDTFNNIIRESYRLRREKYVENTKQLVIKPGKYKDAINFGSYNYLGFGGYPC